MHPPVTTYKYVSSSYPAMVPILRENLKNTVSKISASNRGSRNVQREMVHAAVKRTQSTTGIVGFSLVFFFVQGRVIAENSSSVIPLASHVEDHPRLSLAIHGAGLTGALSGIHCNAIQIRRLSRSHTATSILVLFHGQIDGTVFTIPLRWNWTPYAVGCQVSARNVNWTEGCHRR